MTETTLRRCAWALLALLVLAVIVNTLFIAHYLEHHAYGFAVLHGAFAAYATFYAHGLASALGKTP